MNYGPVSRKELYRDKWYMQDTTCRDTALFFFRETGLWQVNNHVMAAKHLSDVHVLDVIGFVKLYIAAHVCAHHKVYRLSAGIQADNLMSHFVVCTNMCSYISLTNPITSSTLYIGKMP